VANIQTDLRNQGKPKFVFDTAKFPDWATAGNVYTNPDDITGDGYGNKDDLPTSGMNISQCVSGSNCNKLVEKCDPWQDEELSAGAFYHRDHLPEIPKKLSIARKLIDAWLNNEI
jgi:hypothetical protein